MINRRQLLSSVAAGVASTAAQGLTQAVSVSGEWIDAHAHIWTRDVSRYPLKEGATLADLTPASFTAAELLATAKPLGVNRVVLIGHTQFYGFDNRYLLDAADEHPGVFKVVAIIDDRQAAPDTQMRSLLRRNVTGFRITPQLRGPAKWLDNDGMRGMWHCASETAQAMCCLIDARDLPQVDRMCADFPDTPVVIDHFARIGVDGQIRSRDVAALCKLARYPRVCVKVSAYYALGLKQPPYRDLLPMIRQVYEAFGPERLMWASDAPYQIVAPHTYAASLELVRDGVGFLTDDEREQLLRGTAARVFGFD